MKISYRDKTLEAVGKKVFAGQRLDFNDGLTLYNSYDIISIGRLADYIRKKRHGNKAFYIYNQHINYTNICSNMCSFCAYAKNEGEDGAYAWSVDDVKKAVMDKIDMPVNELHIVGGLNRELPFSYFTDMLKMLRKVRPGAVIKAFTAVEIDYLSTISGLSVEETVQELKKAGLMMMPGGGAEVMSDRIHDELFPKKIGRKRWLEVIETVHNCGITTNATMLYGHIESLEERVTHLIELRQLQDRTRGFSAFIPLAFHSENTSLNHLPPTTGFDDLKNIAIARLMLDNFDHIKAYWVMIGEKLAQVALNFGADDLDGTIIEEKITHTAGAKTAKGLTDRQMIHLITAGGFEAVERDSFYNTITPETVND